MPNNGFLPFGPQATTSNCLTDLQYAASNGRQNGFGVGYADELLANKAWLNASTAVAALMQFAVDNSGLDCLDSTPLGTLEANFRIAIAASQSGAYYGIDTSSTANVVSIALVPGPTTAAFSGFQHLWIKVANTNTGPVVVNENAFPQRNWLRNDGSALQGGDLKGGVIYGVVNENGAFKLTGFSTSQILAIIAGSGLFPQIVQNVTLYIRSDGSDANNGFSNSASGAFQTIAAAAASASRFTNTATIMLQFGLAGTYAAPNQFPASGNSFILRGDEANPGSYVVSGAGQGPAGPITLNGANLTIRGVTVTNTGNTLPTLLATRNGAITTISTVLTSTIVNASAHSLAFLGGSIVHDQGTVFASSMGGMAQANQGGSVAFNNAISVVNNPTWSNGAVIALLNGTVSVISGTTISGSANGPRYYFGTGGQIQSSGGGQNFFPGNAVGVYAGGGGNYAN